MQITTGYYASENGSKYLQQLCKHFQHKIGVNPSGWTIGVPSELSRLLGE